MKNEWKNKQTCKRVDIVACCWLANKQKKILIIITKSAGVMVVIAIKRCDFLHGASNLSKQAALSSTPPTPPLLHFFKATSIVFFLSFLSPHHSPPPSSFSSASPSASSPSSSSSHFLPAQIKDSNVGQRLRWASEGLRCALCFGTLLKWFW